MQLPWMGRPGQRLLTQAVAPPLIGSGLRRQRKDVSESPRNCWMSRRVLRQLGETKITTVGR